MFLWWLWSKLLCIFGIFFFKQKTAYEMRISDWSSDVCSSDLIDLLERRQDGVLAAVAGVHHGPAVAGAPPDIRGRGCLPSLFDDQQIGRASCRERVCQYV